MAVESPSRIAPLVYYSLWLALSRFDVGLCRELEERHRVSVAKLERTKSAPVLSEFPVKELLADLICSEFYKDIVWFAGEAAFSDMAGVDKKVLKLRFPAALSGALKRLQHVLPGIATEVEDIGGGKVFRVRRSPFVIDGLGRQSCAFIGGFVTAAMLASGNSRFSAEESMCASMNPELSYCLFEMK